MTHLEIGPGGHVTAFISTTSKVSYIVFVVVLNEMNRISVRPSPVVANEWCFFAVVLLRQAEHCWFVSIVAAGSGCTLSLHLALLICVSVPARLLRLHKDRHPTAFVNDSVSPFLPSWPSKTSHVSHGPHWLIIDMQTTPSSGCQPSFRNMCPSPGLDSCHQGASAALCL
jgi:hypothetical protein